MLGLGLGLGSFGYWGRRVHRLESFIGVQVRLGNVPHGSGQAGQQSNKASEISMDPEDQAV